VNDYLTKQDNKIQLSLTNRCDDSIDSTSVARFIYKRRDFYTVSQKSSTLYL